MGRLDAGNRRNHRVDLAELKPLPVDLHLEVGTSHVFELPVTADAAPPHEVASGVHPRSGRSVRAGDEGASGELRSTQIPDGQLHAGQVELADDTRHHGCQVVVENDRGGSE